MGMGEIRKHFIDLSRKFESSIIFHQTSDEQDKQEQIDIKEMQDVIRHLHVSYEFVAFVQCIDVADDMIKSARCFCKYVYFTQLSRISSYIILSCTILIG